jgi:hypothetical protein
MLSNLNAVYGALTATAVGHLLLPDASEGAAARAKYPGGQRH